MKFFLLLLIFPTLLFSQTSHEPEFYKAKFFLYPTIGTDSALIYVNKIFVSKKPVDLAFAYTAKRHLLTITGKNNDEKSYLGNISLNLKKLPETDPYFEDLSNIYNILGNTDKANGKLNDALIHFIKSSEFAEKKNDIKQIIKVRGNIASIKGDIGLMDGAIKEKKHILFLLKKNKSILPKDYYNNNYNLNTLSIGVLYLQKTKKENNKKFADSTIIIIKTLKNNDLDNISKARMFQYLGNAYNAKKNYNTASDYFLKSIALYSNLELVAELTSTKYNLAYNYFEQGNYKSAKKYFSSIIENKKDTLNNFDYVLSHEYLAKIYIAENKKDSADFYLNTFLELYDKRTEAEKKQFAEVYKNLENKNLTDEIKNIRQENSALKNNSLFSGSIIIGFIFLLFTVIYHQRKKKKQAERNIEILLEKIENKNGIEEKPFSKLTITNEKEQEIITGLIKLEQQKYFLKQEFNLYNTAKKIGTNTTYLTRVMKNYKNYSFNDYTNELRINYLLDLLVSDKKIRNYTVQSLAELIGYKNGSSFSKIFKDKTGITPFQFIEKLKTKE